MNSPMILVIEDDAPVRNLIVTTLKTHDYRYLTAKNGAEAILMAASHNPDVLFLDLGLPDMDGIDVIRQVRTWSNLPIIVISARSDDGDKIEALDAGADDYLTKPFSVEAAPPMAPDPIPTPIPAVPAAFMSFSTPSLLHLGHLGIISLLLE